MPKSNKILGSDVALVNQIRPHVNKWAWDLYLKGCANNWMPTEVPMQKDMEQWRSKILLSNDEKKVITRCLGFFAGSESLVGNNLLINVFKFVQDAECRQYILRQAMEESIHNLTIVYICDTLQLDEIELYEAYSKIPSIKQKDDFLMKITSDLGRQNFDSSTLEGKSEILRDLITYYIICEGIFFYSGFAMLLSLGRQNKMPGISEQIQYTLRDEVIHVDFGTRLINTIREQEPEIWTDTFVQETIEHVKTAVDLECDYAKDVLNNGILGLNSDMFIDYMKYVANARLDSININFKYEDAKDPFPWLSEQIFMPKQKNFFETRVQDYKSSGLVDDF